MLSNATYVMRNGLHCPFCDSTEITSGSDIDDDGMDNNAEIRWTVTCKACGKKWKDVYVLTGYVEVE